MQNNLVNQFRANPMQVLAQKFNIPQNVKDPRDIVQYLLNSGQVSQAQVNQAMQMRNNPVFRNLM